MTADLTATPGQLGTPPSPRGEGTAADLSVDLPTVAHPLDPLSAAEVSATKAVLGAAGKLTPSLRFVMVTLREPAKPAGLVFDLSAPPPRVSRAITYDRAARQLIEYDVDLGAGEVVREAVVEGKFPSYIGEEMFSVEEIVRADPGWQEAMRKRGVTDFSLVMIDPWPSGYTGPDDDPRTGPRLCRPLTFVRSAPGEHGYARPVEGLICTVDLDAMKVIDVADHGVVPLPKHPGNYDPERMFDPMNRPAFSELRGDLKPISITQPEGPSFSVDGWAVAWQKWNLRVGFTPREGLVLHQITYNDKGRVRPIVYRASLSEMVVPYGDAAPTHWNKNVFDEGEVGMGLMANSLTLGCDCLGYIHYFDAIVNDSDGNPLEIPNAICMHEEDYGIAWKHTDFRTGEVEVRRSRRLVISTICTVGNYEYGFFWYLYTDGTIEFEIKLSGVITTGAVLDGEVPRHGTVVAPGLYGPNHQHFFNVRLDMTVDGEKNSVYEIDSIPDPGGSPTNPRYNTWIAKPELLTTEKAGARNVEWRKARYWKIANRGVKNELGQEVSYKLMPGETVPPMFQKGSAIYDRARFCQHELWVTKFDPDEMYAAGDYPYQSPEVEGLPVYIADDASIVDEDIVVWYTVGAHHIVRPEDWPVMPCSYVGFHLKPVGFFDGNPSLDLPRSTPVKGHCGAEGGACGCSGEGACAC